MPKKLVFELDNGKKIYTIEILKSLGYERYTVDQMVKKDA